MSYIQLSEAAYTEAVPILWALAGQLLLQERVVEALLCLESLLPDPSRQPQIQLQPLQEAKVRLRVSELLFRLGRRSNARLVRRHLDHALLLVKPPDTVPSAIPMHLHDGSSDMVMISPMQREVIETRLRVLCLYARLPEEAATVSNSNSSSSSSASSAASAAAATSEFFVLQLKLLAQASDLASRYDRAGHCVLTALRHLTHRDTHSHTYAQTHSQLRNVDLVCTHADAHRAHVRVGSNAASLPIRHDRAQDHRPTARGLGAERQGNGGARLPGRTSTLSRRPRRP